MSSADPNTHVGFDGRIYGRQGRWRFFKVYGIRCHWCRQGILLIKKYKPRRQIAIEPGSWNGEEWFTPGINRPHAMRCEKTRGQRAPEKPKPDPDFLL